MSQATADVLHAAADLLERDGWCQGVYVSHGGARCAEGAIHAVAPSSQVALDAEMALSRALGGDHPVRWNDAPGRTQKQVAAKLREAAAQEAKS